MRERARRLHGWVLMSNDYHLMVETPEANLVSGMRWLQNTYTRRHNSRKKVAVGKEGNCDEEKSHLSQRTAFPSSRREAGAATFKWWTGSSRAVD